MASVVSAFADNNGNLHSNPVDAVVADLSMILGRVGNDSGLTAGIARILIEKRSEIEAAYADFDAMRIKAGGAS
jgi:hypothetical protein